MIHSEGSSDACQSFARFPPLLVPRVESVTFFLLLIKTSLLLWLIILRIRLTKYSIKHLYIDMGASAHPYNVVCIDIESNGELLFLAATVVSDAAQLHGWWSQEMYAEVTVCFFWLPSLVNCSHNCHIHRTKFQQGKGISFIPNIMQDLRLSLGMPEDIVPPGFLLLMVCPVGTGFQNYVLYLPFQITFLAQSCHRYHAVVWVTFNKFCDWVFSSSASIII
jgi:hypothetical protein